MSQKIKGKVRIERIRYFKNDWGIVLVSPIEMDVGEPVLDGAGWFIAKGVMIDPKEGEERQLIAEEVNDPKWGIQYDLKTFTTNAYVDEGNEESKRKYLEQIFTPLQVEALYAALKDPFTILKEHNAEELVKVKGCRIKNAGRWFEKFESNYSLSRLYIELEEYNLSPNMLKRLIDYYKSPEVVVKKIKDNPYLLTEVGGIGFKTADEIAIKNGMSQWDERRIGAYIMFSLDSHGRQGNSFIPSNELMDELVEQFGDDIPDLAVASTIHGAIKDKLWWSEDKTEIGLKRYYNLEENIAKELKRISNAPVRLCCENIDDRLDVIEKRQGWEFTDQQRVAIKTVNMNNLTIVNGGAGCVDCDTEFFTGEGWKRIANYQNGDKVLQYNSDGTAELVEPLAYIKQPSEELYHFETKYGLSQTLSYNHNVVYITSKGHLNKIPMHEVMKRNKESKNGFCGKFITAFSYEDEGLPLFDNEIRLMVAIFADGHFENYALHKGRKGYRKVRINLKKERKKQRLEMLLDKLQISYKKKASTVDGYHVYNFYAPFIGKHYIKDWYHCSKHQREIIADEVMKWDGNYCENNRYSTNNKDDADFIQFVFTSLGYRASISTVNRISKSYFTNGKKYIRKSVEYSVSYTKRTLVGMSKVHGEPKIQITTTKPKDGLEYCFTVPSGMLVLRKDDKIFATGNCGKTTVAGAIVSLFSDASSAACCLSGKAAARLGEVMGTNNGSTIHRLLGFNPELKGFERNRDNPLPQDLIIIDEISMIGGSLFYSLLQAIPDGAKVVMLGDTGQLEAIGECNVASDTINSNQVPVVTLDKIHRQAEKSAIVTESIKVRNGIQIIPKDYAGIETLGENKDMILDCYSDKSNTAYKTLEYFKSELAENGNDILKVQMIAPMRSRGEASIWNLNKLAQDYYNPSTGQDSVTIKYPNKGVGELRAGDKIIVTQNNYRDCYKADSEEEIKQVAIFNGYIGIILSIEPDSHMVIDFLNLGKVLVPRGLFSIIELAYAITVHKFQGAQVETAIIALDYSSYSLLSKELVYTAITRAQKKCILIAQNAALRFAVDTTKTNAKNTHLKRLLNGEYEKEKLIF